MEMDVGFVYMYIMIYIKNVINATCSRIIDIAPLHRCWMFVMMTLSSQVRFHDIALIYNNFYLAALNT